MAAKRQPEDPVAGKLSDIHELLKDLLIIESAKAGISKQETRKIVGVSSARVSRIWMHLKLKAAE